MIETTFIEGAAFVTIMAALGTGLRLVIKVTKVIDGQLQAMEDNTRAVEYLTEHVGPLKEQVEDHEDRITYTEDAVFGPLRRGRRGERGAQGIQGPAGAPG